MTLEDLYNGKTLSSTISRLVHCRVLWGASAQGLALRPARAPRVQAWARTVTRRAATRACQGCKGRRDGECRECTTRCPNEVKTVLRQVAPGFNVQQQQEVPSKEKCKMGEVTLDIDLERGIKDGDKITFKGKSEQRPGLIPGDVHLLLQELPVRVAL